MTSHPASRSVHPSADIADDHRNAAGSPSDAVPLSDLIAESGPLPVEAALECLERLARRLETHPVPLSGRLDAARILVDDDGDIWLANSESAGEVGESTRGLSEETCDSLGRLLLYVSTARHVESNGAADPATVELPWPIARLAGQLTSESGRYFPTYSALAAEAARMREIKETGRGSDSETIERDPSPDVSHEMERAPDSAAADPRKSSPPGLLAWCAIGCLIVGGIVFAFWWVGT